MKLTEKDLLPLKDAMDPLLQHGHIHRARQLSQMYHKYLDSRRKSKKSVEVDVHNLTLISKELREHHESALSIRLLAVVIKILTLTYLD